MNLNIFQRRKTHKYSALQLTVEPSWSERNYASFAEEGYIKNVIAFRAINMIANAASSVPFVLYRLTSQTDKSPPIARNYFILLSFMILNEKREAFGLPPLLGGDELD